MKGNRVGIVNVMQGKSRSNMSTGRIDVKSIFIHLNRPVPFSLSSVIHPPIDKKNDDEGVFMARRMGGNLRITSINPWISKSAQSKGGTKGGLRTMWIHYVT